MDVGMVPSEFGHIPEHREVTEIPREVYVPYWAIVGEKRGRPRRGCVPLKPNPNWVPPFLPLLVQLGKGGSYSRWE